MVLQFTTLLNQGTTSTTTMRAAITTWIGMGDSKATTQLTTETSTGADSAKGTEGSVQTVSDEASAHHFLVACVLHAGQEPRDEAYNDSVSISSELELKVEF